MKNFVDLPSDVQTYINERFGTYRISGKDAYESHHIFPQALKDEDPENLISILEHKHISHIMPKSKFPELEDQIGNIILEDAGPNMERGAVIMSDSEIENARLDLLKDIQDGDVDDDGIIDLKGILEGADNNDILHDLIGTITPIGLFLSGALICRHIKKKEITLEEAPRFFIYDTGKRTVRVAVVGTMLATGSPIVVSGTVGYILFRSKKLLHSAFIGIYSGITSDITKSVLMSSASVILATSLNIVALAGKTAVYTYKGIKSDTSKSIGKGFIKGAWNLTKGIAYTAGATVTLISTTSSGIKSLFKKKN